jgi:hypothetical protein
MRGRRGSPLGNPFKIKTDDEREEAVARYEAWLREKIAAGDREVVASSTLCEEAQAGGMVTPTVLVRPKRCHAEVIARFDKCQA